MRLGPLAATLLLGGWFFLAAMAWAGSALLSRRAPHLSALALALPTGLVSALIPPLLGQRGGGGLLVSLLLAFASAFLLCFVLALRPRGRPDSG